MPESKRRGLSPEEHENAATALTDLSDCHLSPTQLSLYRSLESYFSWDGKLSNKQLDALERLHRTATRGVYGTAESDSDRLNAKLNVVFNPMKNGRKH
jgi:hypothetical protein